MHAIRPHIVFGFVASATAAAAAWSWPRTGLALLIAFAGLALLNLYLLSRLWNLERELTGGRSVRVASRKAPSRGDSPASKRRRGSTSSRSPERPTVRGERPEVDEATADRVRDEDVERLLRQRLGKGASSESGDVLFLRPYASDEAAAGQPVTPVEETPPEGSDEISAGTEAEDPPESAEQVSSRNVPIPRHFALGTVAIIRKALTPAQVAEVLAEQRKEPNARFGEAAVALGYLSRDRLEELLVAQRKGLFTDREIREARERIQAYREKEAEAAEAKKADDGDAPGVVRETARPV